jgi:hypothetical protein
MLDSAERRSWSRPASRDRISIPTSSMTEAIRSREDERVPDRSARGLGWTRAESHSPHRRALASAEFPMNHRFSRRRNLARCLLKSED